MSEVIKFTEEEISSIKNLQNKYSDNMVSMGRLSIDRINLEKEISNLTETEKNLRTEYENLIIEEKKLIDSLSQKYGNGSLNIKDGTFTPSP